MKVAVCDYGAGNVRSVLAAFARLDAEVSVADTPAAVAAADLAVLPGVGSAASAMGVLRERGLDEALRARVAGGGPTLGICLGLQLALDQSDEDGGVQGLGRGGWRDGIDGWGQGNYLPETDRPPVRGDDLASDKTFPRTTRGGRER